MYDLEKTRGGLHFIPHAYVMMLDCPGLTFPLPSIIESVGYVGMARTCQYTNGSLEKNKSYKYLTLYSP